MATPAKDVTRPSKKPGIPRPSGIRQSLGQISKKAISEVIGHGHGHGNKENSGDYTRTTVSVTLKAVAKDVDTTEFGKTSLKSPLSAVTVRPTATKVDTLSRASNTSPSSPRKHHGYSASVPSVSAIKPRDSIGGGTALPKYKPKGSLLPLKQVTITRKRKNSLIEEEEQDTSSAPESKKITHRPLSPLPRRSRVQSTVSDSSRIFDPKVTLKSNQLRTPVKTKPGSGSTMSTPSSVRIRTLSTNSSRLSAPSKSSIESPVKRIDKRPRLSSESRPGKPALANSTSTIAADISSDSIDIADVSALLAVSPNVSPTKSVAPSSVRRVTVRRTANPPSGPPTPSRKTGVSTLPSRHNTAYLSPPANPPARKPISRPGGGLTSRKSIMSWADFSNIKLGEEDVNLIAEITPLQGIVTPGSEDFHPRERVDSGWGLTQENSRTFSVAPSGPSIGQLMFPTLDGREPKLEDTLPPDGEAVVAKLLRVKLTAAEEEVLDLRARINALDKRFDPTSNTSATLQVNVVSPQEAAITNELALQRLQNAELEARTAVLEESLAIKMDELERSSVVIHRLEEECEEERRKGDISIQALMDEVPMQINRKVEEVTSQRVATAINAVENRWMARLQYMLALEEGTCRWRDVKSTALNDLEVVRQSMATLKVLAAGVEALKLDTKNTQ